MSPSTQASQTSSRPGPARHFATMARAADTPSSSRAATTRASQVRGSATEPAAVPVSRLPVPAAAGPRPRAVDSNASRPAPSRPSASASRLTVSLRGFPTSPRSRSLTVRSLSLAASARSRWVIRAAVRSCLSSTAKELPDCSAITTSGTNPGAGLRVGSGPAHLRPELWVILWLFLHGSPAMSPIGSFLESWIRAIG